MKKTYRNKVFETNSSSVHNFTLSYDYFKYDDTHIFFGFGAYGWGKYETTSKQFKANYIWTVLMYANEKIREIYKTKIKDYLNKNNITCSFQDISDFKNQNENNYYVDHGEEKVNMVLSMIDSGELIEFILNDKSVLEISNNNY